MIKSRPSILACSASTIDRTPQSTVTTRLTPAAQRLTSASLFRPYPSSKRLGELGSGVSAIEEDLPQWEWISLQGVFGFRCQAWSDLPAFGEMVHKFTWVDMQPSIA